MPVSRDYAQANQILQTLDEMTDSDFSCHLATTVWKLITLTREEDRAIIKALPASLTDVVSLLQGNGLSLESVDIHLANIYKTLSSSVAQKAWEILRNLVSQDEPQRVLNALPKSLRDVPLAIELGAAKFSLTEHFNVRSSDWLETNGRCIDNLTPGMSKMPQAGYGAFATRSMKKGQVIAPVPVAQGHRQQMELYDALNHNDPNSRFFLVGQQVLLNYAFGHADSNLLLFPYSPVVSYINHNSTSYNVELQWSNLSAHRSEWLAKSPSELTSTLDELGLVLELVATRDIEAGEEVLIDYGSKWEAAWNNHVAQWTSPKASLSYVSAAALNARREWIRTRAELLLKPYPYNVQTICFVSAGAVRPESEGMAGAADWINVGEALYRTTKSAFPCQVWERVIRQELDESSRYKGNQISHHAVDVSIQELMSMDASESDEKVTYNVKVLRKEGNFFLKGLPRRAIQFFDNQYTSDQFLRNAFRHEMHLPDHLVPAAWKDLKVDQ
jgi:SET domain